MRLNVLIVLLTTMFGCQPESSHLPFDATIWRAEAPEVRGRMLQSLLGLNPNTHPAGQFTSVPKSSPLHGLTEEKVEALLGIPDGSRFSDHTLVYDVGHLGDDGYLKERYHLFIVFDDHGGDLKEIRVYR